MRRPDGACQHHLAEIRPREFELGQFVLRKVDAASAGVFDQIANDVCELERDPALLGHVQRSPIVESPNVDAGQPHDRSNTIALLMKVPKGRITPWL